MYTAALHTFVIFLSHIYMQGAAKVLHRDGYFLFRNVLTTEEVDKGASCINVTGEFVDYANMHEFIIGTMFKHVEHLLGLTEPMSYVKYRVSDNNNSADAAAFHRDLMFQGNTPHIFPPCFTCLTYFDTTTMELIPGSHVKNYALVDTPFVYAKRVRLEIHPGDILLFFSTLLHRGIFTEGIKHRRLIQVFEVFTSRAIKDTFTPLVVHVPGNETYSDWMVTASKGNGPIISMINMYGFLNAATGYGWKHRLLEKCGLQGTHLFFSSEGLRGRLTVTPGTWQPINKYVLNNDIEVYDISNSCYGKYKYYAFNRQFYYYSMLIIVATLTAVVILYNVVSRIIYVSYKYE